MYDVPIMDPTKGMLAQLEKLIRKNVIMHFASKPKEEKTLEKVETFANKQLDFFLDGMMKQSPDLTRAWKKGHPFTAKAAINRETLDFEIQIVEREPGKF